MVSNNSGKTIENWRLHKNIGSGTYGEAYYASNQDGEKACVKLFKGLDSTIEQSFQTELQAGYADFDH